jgi:hypothetical protein
MDRDALDVGARDQLAVAGNQFFGGDRRRVRAVADVVNPEHERHMAHPGGGQHVAVEAREGVAAGQRTF